MNCCSKKNKKRRKEKGFWPGLIYGLIPHIGCIAFIVFTVLGVTTATVLFKPLLLNPYFFYILIALSLVFATISAFFYFKKQGFITLSKKGDGLEISFLPAGLKRKWKYLLTLYGTTVFVNLLLFMVIFPIAANLQSESILGAAVTRVSLQVAIPCPGHAPLIIGELREINGVENVKFRFPNLFDVGYEPEKTSKEQILSLDVFDTYKATIIDESASLDDIQLVGNTEELQPLGSDGGCCGGGNGCGCGSAVCGGQ